MVSQSVIDSNDAGNLSACLRIMMRSGARGKWRVGVDLVSIGETDPTLAVRFPVQTCESFGFLSPRPTGGYR